MSLPSGDGWRSAVRPGGLESAGASSTGASVLHDPSHYEPPPIAAGDRAEPARPGRPAPAGLGAGRDRRAAGPSGEGAALAEAQRPAVGPPDGLDQRDLLARDERRRRADAADRASLGPRPGARPAAHALPVAAPARRHDRQRFPRLPAGHPQHRLRHHRGCRRGAGRTTANDIVSRHFHIQIRDFADLEKIQMPVVTHNEAATALPLPGDVRRSTAASCRCARSGQTHIWFTPWDYLIRWWGIQEAMLDLVERPDLVHAAVERMVDAWMVELDQFVAQNLLSLDCEQHAHRLRRLRLHRGSCPGERFDPACVTPHNMWGCSNAQIFSEVSPQMHWEFALEHDLRWLARWGLTYYGCCEPLDRKIDLLRRIPNLRKISVSPWCRHGQRGRADRHATTSSAASPTRRVFAEDEWHPERARQDLRDFLDAARGCHVRADHEGHLHGPLPAAAALGVGRHRDGGRRGLRGLTERRSASSRAAFPPALRSACQLGADGPDRLHERAHLLDRQRPRRLAVAAVGREPELLGR